MKEELRELAAHAAEAGKRAAFIEATGGSLVQELERLADAAAENTDRRTRPMSKLSADTGNDYPIARAGLQDALDAATANRFGSGIGFGVRPACDPPEIFPNKDDLSLPAGVDALVTVHESSTLSGVLRSLAVSSYNAGVCASGRHTVPLIPLLIKDALLRADELAATSGDDLGDKK